MLDSEIVVHPLVERLFQAVARVVRTTFVIVIAIVLQLVALGLMLRSRHMNALREAGIEWESRQNSEQRPR